VKGLSSGLVKKLYEGGFTTVGSILNITVVEMQTVDGFKKTLATKLHSAIQERVKSLDIYTVMDASNELGRGFGQKKIKLICEALPRILVERYIPSLQELVYLKGIEEKTASRFIKNLPSFFKFMDDNKIKIVDEKKKHDIGASSSSIGVEYVKNKTFVFSGIRDKDIEEFIEANGGKVASSVTNNTTIVVVKSTETESAKTIKAHSLFIPVMLIEDLRHEIEK
jgi:NAD-dependent DNA ligase